jgi:hypothetical protein
MPEKDARKGVATDQKGATEDLPTRREEALFGRAVEGQRWEDLTSENFPRLSTAQAKAFYFTKLGIINTEVANINQTVENINLGREALATLNGRLKGLSNAASETIGHLFPDVTPVYEATGPVTPEDFSRIEAFVEGGALEQLNDDVVPGWDKLSHEQRLLFRIRALLVRYSQWQSVAEDQTIDEKNTVGFTKKQTGEITVPDLRRVSQIVQDKIVTRYLNQWLDEARKEGLDLDNPMVKSAQRLANA